VFLWSCDLCGSFMFSFMNLIVFILKFMDLYVFVRYGPICIGEVWAYTY
jgi:hypothetical protein